MEVGSDQGNSQVPAKETEHHTQGLNLNVTHQGGVKHAYQGNGNTGYGVYHLQANTHIHISALCRWLVPALKKGVASECLSEDSSVRLHAGGSSTISCQQCWCRQAGSSFTWRHRKPRGRAAQLTMFPQRKTQGKCLSLQQQCFESLQSRQTSLQGAY